jgi:hypothetical protein
MNQTILFVKKKIGRVIRAFCFEWVPAAGYLVILKYVIYPHEYTFQQKVLYNCGYPVISILFHIIAFQIGITQTDAALAYGAAQFAQCLMMYYMLRWARKITPEENILPSTRGMTEEQVGSSTNSLDSSSSTR